MPLSPSPAPDVSFICMFISIDLFFNHFLSGTIRKKILILGSKFLSINTAVVPHLYTLKFNLFCIN